jgi:hypothetical protein
MVLVCATIRPLKHVMYTSAGMCACQCFTCASREVLRKSARMAYCFLFTLALVLSWVRLLAGASYSFL